MKPLSLGGLRKSPAGSFVELKELWKSVREGVLRAKVDVKSKSSCRFSAFRQAYLALGLNKGV